MPNVSKTVLVLVLGSLIALGPLSIDLYLPALPAIAADLGAAPSRIQLTLSACILGLALGQLLVGPWSDAAGRRAPLFAGLALYVAASLGCAVAPNAEALAALRFAQGLGGSAALVIATAVVRDLHSGHEAARFFSLLMLVMGVAPILAPLLGAGLLRLSTWHATFVALAGAALVIGAAVHARLPETLPPERRNPAGLAMALNGFADVLRDRCFRGYTLTAGLSFGAMFTYIAASPFVLQRIHQLSPDGFALVFGANALGLVALAQVNGRLVHRVAPRRLMLAGLAAAALAGLGLVGVVLAAGPLAALLAGLFVVVAAQGLVMPNASALALARHGRRAGSAAALLGTSRFLFGAVAAPLAGVAGEASALPMAAIIAVTATAALLACLRAEHPLPH